MNSLEYTIPPLNVLECLEGASSPPASPVKAIFDLNRSVCVWGGGGAAFYAFTKSLFVSLCIIHACTNMTITVIMSLCLNATFTDLCNSTTNSGNHSVSIYYYFIHC